MPLSNCFILSCTKIGFNSFWETECLLMNKNSFLPLKVLKTKGVFIAIIAMVVSFFFSRAALSMTVMLCGFLGLLGVHPRHWLKQTWWLLGAAWVFFFFISGFWSHDMDYWQTRCEVKLPILLLPLAFAFVPAFSHRRKEFFSV